MLDSNEQAELARLEAAFEESGGRGVDLAERIDYLRLKRDGVDITVRMTVDDLLFMDSEAFEDEVEVHVPNGGGGVLSAWNVKVEGIEGDGETLVLRVTGDWE